jgi:hypothetical protein
VSARDLAGVLAILGPLNGVAIAYVIRVYLGSRRNEDGELPLLYRGIAYLTVVFAVNGILISGALGHYWANGTFPFAGGLLTITVGLAELLPVAIALMLWAIRRSR